MKVLIAPNAFKGTIDADIAAEIIRSSLIELDNKLEIDLCPIADGGDGTCQLIGEKLELQRIEMLTLDPIGRPVLGYFYWDESSSSAYLDVSTASGIKLLDEAHKKPKITSTFGTGLLIQKAISLGVKQVYIGLGGTASIDLGIGILAALGYVFLDENGRALIPFTDTFLFKIKYIQRPIQKSQIQFTFICDVGHYFFGKMGAIHVFGPQKGLKSEDFEKLELTCTSLLELFKLKTGVEIKDQPSFGAAGGIAYGLSYFFPIEIQMGAQWVFKKLGIDKKVMDADLIITGEGRYDSQSVMGKGSYELLKLAKKYNKSIILLTAGDGGRSDGFDQVISLPELNFQDVDFINKAKLNLKEASLNIVI